MATANLQSTARVTRLATVANLRAAIAKQAYIRASAEASAAQLAAMGATNPTHPAGPPAVTGSTTSAP